MSSPTGQTLVPTIDMRRPPGQPVCSEAVVRERALRTVAVPRRSPHARSGRAQRHHRHVPRGGPAGSHPADSDRGLSLRLLRRGVTVPIAARRLTALGGFHFIHLEGGWI